MVTAHPVDIVAWYSVDVLHIRIGPTGRSPPILSLRFVGTLNRIGHPAKLSGCESHGIECTVQRTTNGSKLCMHSLLSTWKKFTVGQWVYRGLMTLNAGTCVSDL